MNLFDIEPERYWGIMLPYTQKSQEEFIKKAAVSNNYVCSEKYDGNWARFVIQDGEKKIQSRNRGRNTGMFGELQEKVPHIFEALSTAIKGNSMIIGELYTPGGDDKDVGSIMRCLPKKAVQRQEERGKLLFKIFDVWYLFGQSYMDTPFIDRIEQPLHTLRKLFHNHPYISVVEFHPVSEVYSLLDQIFERGGEGVVLQKISGVPEPGKRPVWKSLKIKREIYGDVDMFCSGFEEPTREYNGAYIEDWAYWENVKNGLKFNKKMYKTFYEGSMLEPITKNYYYGWVSSLLCSVWKGNEAIQLCKVSNLTDELKMEIKENPDKFLYKPMRIAGMEFSTNQVTNELSIRHPKFRGFRDDISDKDCTYDKIVS